jgi:serine/threonine protein kinase
VLDATHFPQLEEHVPDYFVKPRRESPKPYGLFLPRNAFSQNSANSIFSIQSLEFVAQGEWFTVFRYSGQGVEPIIIKRANIFPMSFKYLLREKAMLGYLNHRNIARPISLARFGLKKNAKPKGLVDGGFHPLACLGAKNAYWNDTYFMYEDGGLSLKEWHASRQLSLGDVRSITLQLLEVLIYLQSMKVVHRDIRMESFVWSNGTLKLISLGKSRYMEQPTQEEKDAMDQFMQEWRCSEQLDESRAILGGPDVRCRPNILFERIIFCSHILLTPCRRLNKSTVLKDILRPKLHEEHCRPMSGTGTRRAKCCSSCSSGARPTVILGKRL